MIADYLAASSALYREVYDVVAPNIPAGFEHSIEYGMPAWSVPLAVYPDTYNGHPLSYVALAQQKQYVALYLSLYQIDPAADAAFRTEYAAATGRRIDMGKSCLRLRRAEDVDAELIARAVAATSVDEFIAVYERSRS